MSLRQIAQLIVAAGCFALGLGLAWHHPIAPLLVLAAFWLWCLLVLWRPSIWLVVVPACVPVLNFSPWTGWIVFDEFDILLAGALAALKRR